MFLKFKKNKQGFMLLEVIMSVVVFMMVMVVAAQSLSNSFFITHRLNQKSYLLLKAMEAYSEQFAESNRVPSTSPLYAYDINRGEGFINIADQRLAYDYYDLRIIERPSDVVRVYKPTKVAYDEE